MVLAGPGSGKTFVITHRIQYLTENLKVDPRHILVVTFSKAAAMEMRERYNRMEGAKGVTFGTFHSVFFALLKTAYGFQGEQIISDGERFAIMKELMVKNRLVSEDPNDLAQKLLEEIALLKQDQIRIEHYYPKSAPAEAFRGVYSGYESALQEKNKLDFEDMLTLTYELFSQRPDILRAVQNRYRYILIDEFQDINRIQYEIIRMMAGERKNLTVVGDDDQSIYRFRGARPEIMLHFPKDYPGAAQVLLDINFRSSSQIVEASAKLIARNKERFQKKFTANRGKLRPVAIGEFNNPLEEVLSIIKDLQGYKALGISFDQVAVLYRTNLQPRLLSEQLMKYAIPFVIKDNIPNLFEHWIAKDVKAYIRLALGQGRRADWLRIYNKPNRYIKRESLFSTSLSIDYLLDYYSDKPYMVDRILELKWHLKSLSRLTPGKALAHIRRAMGYFDYLKEYCRERSIDAEEFTDVYSELESSAAEYQTFEDWFCHMEEYAKELQDAREKSKKQEHGVRLMTFHGAKGLEFDIVYIIDVNEGIVPYKKAKSKAELEEERRMFYVAMTRARDRLFICYCKKNYHKEYEKSLFITELQKPDSKKAD